MNWNDVPTEVIESVLNKWKQILAHGEWRQDKIWIPCALCVFIDCEPISNTHCYYHCPASNGDWCKGGAYDSKLALSSQFNEYNHEKWLDNVEEFCNGLEKHLNRRKERENDKTI